SFYGHIFPDPAVVSPAMISTAAGVNFKLTVLSEMGNRDQKVNQMSTFYAMAQQQLDPNSIHTIPQQIWELMGFDSKDIRAANLNPQPAAGGAAPGATPNPVLPTGAPSANGAAPSAAAGKQILAAHQAGGNGGTPPAPAAASI